MKRSALLLATVTLSSTLCAQQWISRAQAQELLEEYNPQLLERASQSVPLQQVIDQMVNLYLEQKPQDTLANRYAFIALARNFDNSLALAAITQEYQENLYYAYMSGVETQAVYAHAYRDLMAVYARVWAVSVQVKEKLLQAYQQAQKELRKSTVSSDEQRLLQQYAQDASVLKADLKSLYTQVGEELPALSRNALWDAQEQLLARLATSNEKETFSTKESDNLQIKTKHKKPVAK